MSNPYRHLVKPIEKTDLLGTEMLTGNLFNFFMDLSEPQNNYFPHENDDICHPLNRLWKLLYYDDNFPLANELPTDEQKKSVRYTGKSTGTLSAEEQEKDFRMFPVRLTQYAQLPAQTVMRIYTAEKRAIDREFNVKVAVNIQIITSTTLEWLPDQNMSRLDSMEQAIVEALNGLPIEGGGIAWQSTSEIGDMVRNIGKKLLFIANCKQDLSINRYSENE